MAAVSSAQTLTTLASFNGTNGQGPSTGVVQGSDGNFYGTTYLGGANGVGTVFKISPTGELTTLYSFCSRSGCVDGKQPAAPLVQGSDGNFYGTTEFGGAYSEGGTIFKISPSGEFGTVYNFCSVSPCMDGAGPVGGLVQGSDGNFYGTTKAGGLSTWGTIFRFIPDGSLITLYRFCQQNGCPDGAQPIGALVQGRDGSFYGVTESGGNGAPGGIYGGTVFKITSSGTFTQLYRFCSLANCVDGASPYAALTLGIDGNFYGTTSWGGTPTCGINGCGTAFKITPNGNLTTLYSFCSQAGCADGGYPEGLLVQATDGNFYGTTAGGGAGAGQFGTIFEISPAGDLTTLYSFCLQGGSCTDGKAPEGVLYFATDGNFYGTTPGGGTNNDGTVYRLQVQFSYALTVSTSGNGTVASTDGFIHCPGTCSHAYSSGTPVTLNATPGQGWFFGGWNGACVGTSSCIVTVTQTLAAGAVFSEAEQFVPLSQPCRAVDTRPGSGGNGPIPGGTFQNFAISGEGSCAALPNAAVYSMNITVVPGPKLGYLTIWPAGEPQPVVSTLNSVDGRVKADAAIVPVGANGAVSIYVTDTTNVIVDVNGYFAPPTSSTLAFYPLPPCRVADTRKSTFPQGLGPPSLLAGVERQFPILNATTCNIPSSVAAYSLNFTVVPSGTLGYLTVWPTGQTRPTVSTLNDVLGRVIANAAIVVAGTGSEVSAYATNDTDLVIDINGYFAPAGAGGLSLYPAAPCRVLDTRHVGSGQPFTGTLSPPVDVVHSVCGVTSVAQAYVFNATVIPVQSLGYLTLWPNGENQAVVSTLNAADGSVTNNMAIVPAGTAGKVDAYANGLTQLLLDISSYFAP